MFQVQAMQPIPANANPFQHDAFNMGAKVGDDWMAMYGGHDNNEYIILVHLPTGQRLRVHRPTK